MSTHANSLDAPALAPLSLVSLVIADSGRIALVVAPPARWHADAGYTFAPAELPGGAFASETPLAHAAGEIALRLLDSPVQIIPSDRLYGPSVAHAIDRLDASTEPPPLPLLRLERQAPLDAAPAIDAPTSQPQARRSVIVRAYRAKAKTADAPLRPGPDAVGLLWLTPRTLRHAMLGLPFAELLAQPETTWRPAEGVALPDDLLIYVPSDYGERHLLRIVAKYGRAALFQDD